MRIAVAYSLPTSKAIGGNEKDFGVKHCRIFESILKIRIKIKNKNLQAGPVDVRDSMKGTVSPH
jgi:hypothetical protein